MTSEEEKEEINNHRPCNHCWSSHFQVKTTNWSCVCVENNFFISNQTTLSSSMTFHDPDNISMQESYDKINVSQDTHTGLCDVATTCRQDYIHKK